MVLSGMIALAARPGPALLDRADATRLISPVSGRWGAQTFLTITTVPGGLVSVDLGAILN
jgi:hypothetical protein